MLESIEQNASIIGRIFQPYYKSLIVKLHITEKDQYTLIEQSISNQAADCSIRVYQSFLSHTVLKSKDVLQPLIMCP